MKSDTGSNLKRFYLHSGSELKVNKPNNYMFLAILEISNLVIGSYLVLDYFKIYVIYCMY